MKRKSIDIKNVEKSSYNFKLSEVYNFDTGKIEAADYWLSQSEETVHRFRYSLEEGTKNYGCPVCKNRVIIKKSKLSNFFFSHTKLKEGQQCFLVDNSDYEGRRIQEYNYRKESQEHILLKETIAYHLRNTKGVKFNSVKVEKVIKGQAVPKTWKKPDVQFVTEKGKRFAVEIQLSNTWLNDIVKRDMFYKEEGVSILWIFKSWESYGYEKTTKKDIAFNNEHMNVFVFDKDAAWYSDRYKNLHLKCYFKKPEKTGPDSYTVKWDDKIVSLKDFKFDKKSHKPYVIDSFKLIDEANEWSEEQKELIKTKREKYLQELFESQEKKRKKRYEEQQQAIADKWIKKEEVWLSEAKEQAKPMVKIVGKVDNVHLFCVHLPTQKKYKILYKKQNKQGTWYHTDDGNWLFSKDCMLIDYSKYSSNDYLEPEPYFDEAESILLSIDKGIYF